MMNVVLWPLCVAVGIRSMWWTVVVRDDAAGDGRIDVVGNVFVDVAVAAAVVFLD